MNSEVNSNENNNEQPIVVTTPTGNVENVSTPVMQTTNETVQQAVVNAVQTPVEPVSNIQGGQYTQPIATQTSAAQVVSTSTEPTTQATGPVPPQQQRVKLIDDKPGLKAIMPTGTSVSPTGDNTVTGNTEILDVVEPPVEELSQTVSPEKSHSKAKTFFLFLLFGGLFVMIIFLPDISSYIETQKYLKTQKEEVITTGTLQCSYESSSTNMDYSYQLDFGFNSSKLTRLTYVLETRGDANLDEAALNTLKAECDNLALSTEKLGGVTVSCNLEHGTLTQKQVLNYSSIVVDDAITAYMEAGGIYPDYENGESIDTIEREMNASGYTCERIK